MRPWERSPPACSSASGWLWRRPPAPRGRCRATTAPGRATTAPGNSASNNFRAAQKALSCDDPKCDADACGIFRFVVLLCCAYLVLLTFFCLSRQGALPESAFWAALNNSFSIRFPDYLFKCFFFFQLYIVLIALLFL